MDFRARDLYTVRSSPGDLLHYQKPVYGMPLWPAIHLDAADPEISRLLGPPSPLMPAPLTPIVLLGTKLEL